MSNKYYNIHNLVKFVLIGPQNFSDSYRYSNYKIDFIPNEELDFIVKLGKFTPNINNCSILDDRYYVKKNYFYCKEDSYKIIKWEIEIKNIETAPIHVNINIKSASYVNIMNSAHILLEGIIIDSLIHYILTLKNCALIHASCVSKNSKGLIFIARGGAGKTSISTQLIDKGFNFISDNYTILTSDSELIGFIEPLNIFTYNLNKEIQNSLDLTQKIELKIKSMLYKLSGGYIKIFVRVNPLRIFKNIRNRANFNSAFLLIPSNEIKSDIQLSKIFKDKLAKHIYFNQIMEFPYFDKYITMYSYEFPRSKVSNHWNNYYNIIINNICKNAYIIKMPKNIDETIIKNIIEAIGND